MRRNDETYWKGRLTPEQYRITRLRGTEPAYSGEYCDTHELGVYRCVCCDAPLFESNVKFDSGTGWPSFSAPIDEQAVEQRADQSFLMRRTEVLCHACGAHLGHLFTDGPAPTRRRYSINSVALRLEPASASQPESGTPPQRRQVERRRVQHP